MSTPRIRRGAFVLALTVSALAVAFAATPAADASTVYACVKKNGTARIFTKKPKCKKGESKVSWNNVGPAGNNGTNGANGLNGKDGAAGKDGLNGTAIAYAEVSSTGTLGGNSKGVIKMTPGSSPVEGIYCLQLESPKSVHVGVGSLNLLGGGSQPGFVGVDLGPVFEVIFGSCSSETSVAVHTYNAKGEVAPEGFFVIFD